LETDMQAARLSQLVPFNGLSEEALQLAVQQGRALHLEQGQTLFSRGEEDQVSYYLLEGEVSLDSEDTDTPALIIRAGSDAARHPLARLKPRLYTCVARVPCELAQFADDALDHLVARDQATSYEVTEFEGDDPSWLFDLLGNQSFSRVPPANLHALFGRFEPLQVEAGQDVIRQGEIGDYYYLIREGSAQVTRSIQGGKPVLLARLEPGQGFGEDALISGEPRNASVTMLSKGLLMRLAASDFRTLLQDPLVRRVAADEAAAMVRGHGAMLIDVRMEDEYRQGSLKGSINLPLYLLRLRAKALDPARPYILFCQTGRRSSTAAFLLAQRGFDVHVLSGGLDAMNIFHPASNS
jgi:CRP-like cAMP-binding protein